MKSFFAEKNCAEKSFGVSNRILGLEVLCRTNMEFAKEGEVFFVYGDLNVEHVLLDDGLATILSSLKRRNNS